MDQRKTECCLFNFPRIRQLSRTNGIEDSETAQGTSTVFATCYFLHWVVEEGVFIPFLFIPFHVHGPPHSSGPLRHVTQLRGQPLPWENCSFPHPCSVTCPPYRNREMSKMWLSVRNFVRWWRNACKQIITMQLDMYYKSSYAQNR